MAEFVDPFDDPNYRPGNPAPRQADSAPTNFVDPFDDPGYQAKRPTQQPAAQPSRGRFLDFATSMMGGAELAANLGTTMLARPVSGLAGIAQGLNPMAPPGASADAVRSVQEGMIYQPREAGRAVGAAIGETVGDAASAVGEYIPDSVKSGAADAYRAIERSPDAVAREYGPLAGAAAKTLPTAILEAVPALSTIRKGRAVAGESARRATAQANTPKAVRATPTMGNLDDIAPTPNDYAASKAAISKGKPRGVVENLAPDAETRAAAERIGVEPIPSAYSTNVGYIDLEQSLKSRPGSKLATVEQRSLTQLGQAADDLINDLGGSTNKSVLDASVKGEISSKIAQLEKASETAYGAVNKAIPQATRVTPRAAGAYVTQKLDDLGGDARRLTTAEREVMSLTAGGAEPTYAALDRVRKNIGHALGRKSGPYKDDDSGILKQLYAALSEDQKGVARQFGVGDEYELGSKLVRTRKGVEDASIELFGREVQGSIIPKLKQGVNALTKGDVSKVRRMFEALPPESRQQAAATMLNDVFTFGSRNPRSVGQGFVSAYRALSENPGLRFEIFKHLPQEAWKRFDDIGRVATGIYRSLGRENTSKTARDVIAAMDEGGLIGKLYAGGKQAAVAEGVTSAVGAPGFGTAGVIVAHLAKGRRPATQAADDLITSPSFRKAIDAYVAGDAGRATLIMDKTPAFQKWLSLQPPDVRREIVAVGMIPFLTAPSDSGTESPPQAGSSRGSPAQAAAMQPPAR